MLKIPSSIEYATRIMVYLAARTEEGPMSAERLASDENIPRDYVNQLLLRLRRAGLVDSRRGAQGGYLLAKPASETTIGQIVRAVDESGFQNACERYSTGDQQCTHTDGCGIRPVWQRISFMVEGFLDDLKLSELLEPQARVESRVQLMFQGPDGPSRARSR